MKIVLENEMERLAWPILVNVHSKWKNKHRISIQEFVEMFKKEVTQAITREVDACMLGEWGPEAFDDVVNVTEEQCVQKWLKNHKEDGLNEEEINQLKKDLAEDYQDFADDFKIDREIKEELAWEDLGCFYDLLLSAPERLTVTCNGEVVQGKNQHQ